MIFTMEGTGQNNTMVDTHFHIWDLKNIRYLWPTADQGPIFKDILLEDYKKELYETPVRKAIFVQVTTEEPDNETAWVIDQAQTEPCIAGIVTGHKLDDPKLPRYLDQYSNHHNIFVGVRNILGFYEDGWILKDAALGGMKQLTELKRKIPYSLLVNCKSQRASVLELVKLFPNHPFVIDHMGKPFELTEGLDGWEQWIGEISKCDNVHCKISSQFFPTNGSLTEAQKAGDFSTEDRKYVNHCLASFGVDRCMFGSDWPVCKLAGLETFGQAYSVARGLMNHLTQEEQDKIFGENAIKFYNLPS